MACRLFWNFVNWEQIALVFGVEKEKAAAAEVDCQIVVSEDQSCAPCSFESHHCPFHECPFSQFLVD